MDYLAANMHTTSKELMYASSAISAALGSKDPIAPACVKGFVLAGIACGNFKWVDAATDQHHERFFGRVAMLFDETVRPSVKSKEKGASGETDDPINMATSDSCAQEYAATYGEPMAVDELPSDANLGKIHRGYVNRNMPQLRLQSMVTQDYADQHSLSGVGFDGGTLVAKSKDPKIKVGTPEKFLAALLLLLNGLVFVGVSQIADTKTWKGDPEVGVVAGKRRQFSRAGALFYYKFWSGIAKQFVSKDVSVLVYLEMDMRDKWKNPFAKGTSLEECMRTSVREYSGMTFAKAAMAKKREGGPRESPPPKSPKTTPPKTPTGQQPMTAYDRAKTKPGFDPNINTIRFTTNKEPICIGFNIRDGCKYTSCKHKHVCDVRKADGTACGEAHERYNHV